MLVRRWILTKETPMQTNERAQSMLWNETCSVVGITTSLRFHHHLQNKEEEEEENVGRPKVELSRDYVDDNTEGERETGTRRYTHAADVHLERSFIFRMAFSGGCC